MNAAGGGEQDAAGVNANLLQETVSSKLKKVSKDELSSRADTAGEYRFKEKYLYHCTTTVLHCTAVDCLLISYLRLKEENFKFAAISIHAND